MNIIPDATFNQYLEEIKEYFKGIINDENLKNLDVFVDVCYDTVDREDKEFLYVDIDFKFNNVNDKFLISKDVEELEIDRKFKDEDNEMYNSIKSDILYVINKVKFLKVEEYETNKFKCYYTTYARKITKKKCVDTFEIETLDELLKILNCLCRGDS